MKRFSKGTAILVAIVAVAILIAAIVFALSKAGDISEHIPSGSASDFLGVWYSDRPDGDTLTLSSDGTYQSSVWLASGTYNVKDDTLYLTDSFGTEKKLVIEKGRSITLHYQNGSYSHAYSRTQSTTAEKTTQAEAAQITTPLSTELLANEDESLDTLYMAAVKQILMTGEWISDNERATLTFTDTTFTVDYKPLIEGDEDSIPESQTRFYELVSLTVTEYPTGSTYNVKWNWAYTEDEQSFSGSLRIDVKPNNEYKLVSASFPNPQIYSKTAEIVFTQPEPSTSEPSTVATTAAVILDDAGELTPADLELPGQGN